MLEHHQNSSKKMFDQVVLEQLKSVLKSVTKDSRQETQSILLFKDPLLVIIMLVKNMPMKFTQKNLAVALKVKWPF